MTDYRIEATTKEEWAKRALRAEADAFRASNAAFLEKRRADEAVADLARIRREALEEAAAVAEQRCDKLADDDDLGEWLKGALLVQKDIRALIDKPEG